MQKIDLEKQFHLELKSHKSCRKHFILQNKMLTIFFLLNYFVKYSKIFTTGLALSFSVKIMNAILKFHTLAADVDYVP